MLGNGKNWLYEFLSILHTLLDYSFTLWVLRSDFLLFGYMED